VSSRCDDDQAGAITRECVDERTSGRARTGSTGRPLLAVRRDNGTKKLRVILPRRCRLLKPADYCHSNKYPLWVSAIDENARSLRRDLCRVNEGTVRGGGIAGFFRKGSAFRLCGVLKGPFASKSNRRTAAPTLVLRTQIKCGSGGATIRLAREGGLSGAKNLSWQSPTTDPPPNGCARGFCHGHTTNRQSHPPESAGSTTACRSTHGSPGRSPAYRCRPCSAHQ